MRIGFDTSVSRRARRLRAAYPQRSAALALPRLSRSPPPRLTPRAIPRSGEATDAEEWESALRPPRVARHTFHSFTAPRKSVHRCLLLRKAIRIEVARAKSPAARGAPRRRKRRLHDRHRRDGSQRRALEARRNGRRRAVMRARVVWLRRAPHRAPRRTPRRTPSWACGA